MILIFGSMFDLRVAALKNVPILLYNKIKNGNFGLEIC